VTVIVEPANLYDLAELSGARTRAQWGLARALFADGRFYAFRAGEQLLALGGFNLLDAELDVAEMSFNPAPLARRHMPGFVTAGRLTILAQPYRSIVTVCRSKPGQAFARRLGFTFQATSELGEVWAYGRSAHGKDGVKATRAAAEPDRGSAADEPGADLGRTG
jgi:hypothetical protein